MIASCPVCGQASFRELSRRDVPVQFVVAPNFRPADADFCRLTVMQCDGCGHLFNAGFDDALTARIYGNVPLTNVPIGPEMHARFSDLRAWIGDDLIHGARIVEIGGGSGHMARVLASDAGAVIVFEPCLQLTPDMLPEPNIDLRSRSFPGPAMDSDVDFVICRQVLEHVSDPRSMIRDIRSVLAPGGHAYLEVPDVAYILNHGAYPDVHVQHVQYFSQANLRRMVETEGFKHLRTLPLKDGHDFGMLFRIAEDEPRHPPAPDRVATASAGGNLLPAMDGQIENARRRLRSVPGPIALYGATLHAQSFLSIVPDDVKFAAVLDDNALLHGHCLYNRVQRVETVAPVPAELNRFATIVVAAYLHDQVIAERLRKNQFNGELFTIRPAPLPDNPWRLTRLSEPMSGT